MTPGQIITAFEVGGALVVLLLAVCRGRRFAVAPALAYGGAIVATRLFKSHLPDELHFMAWAALFVALGSVAISRGIIQHHNALTLHGALLIASGLCYAGAELVGAQTVLFSPFMTSADLFSFAALAALFGGVASGNRNRNFQGHRMDRRDLRGGILARCGVVLASEQEGGR